MVRTLHQPPYRMIQKSKTPFVPDLPVKSFKSQHAWTKWLDASMRTDIHLKALSENDEEQLRKRIGELLSEPKYTKMAEQAEL